ncbi:MAG: DUF5977 domain-containing protein [Bacteroidetes bacterium]|nr:DUF5977 domain-containing protein [Bacteroidota bacterium]
MSRIILIVLTGLFFGVNAHSQNNAFNKPPVNILSPDAANLGKFGTYNVNHYTGTPGINVPIYEINESGVSIPISIGYDASGFIPNKNAGIVGQNWSLTAGGAITRTVKGVPDEKRNPNPNSSSSSDKNSKEHTGYIYGIQNLQPAPLPSQASIENLTFLGTSHNQDPGFPTSNILTCEYNPDIFSFNFLGHSGTFVMGNDGQVKVNGDRRYKVDMSQFITQWNQFNLGTSIGTLAFNQINNSLPNLNSSGGMISKIIITSDDGYIFHFGGNLSALEISFSYAGTNAELARGVEGTSGVINSWYLTKIIAPDGDEVNLDYGFYSYQDAEVLNHLVDINTGWWDSQRQVNFFDIKLFYSNYNETYQLLGASQTGTQPMALQKSLIKLAYLKKIDTKLRTVTFDYSKRNEYNTNMFYTTQPGSTTLFSNMINKNQGYFSSKLDKISIQAKAGVSWPIGEGEFLGSPILTYDFIYQFYGSFNIGNRLFLKELKFNNNNTKYKFDYWRTTELQHPLTAAIDKWGYYNAEPGNVRLIGLSGPVIGDPLEFETNFTYTGQIRTANSTVADIGLLQTITYPTGGKTDFEYEGHKVKKILKKKVNTTGNTMIPVWETLTTEENIGGCRIKKIISVPGITTEYKYIKDYNVNPNGPSSGLLTDYGVFRIKMQRTNGDYHDQLFDQNIVKAAGYSESHVCYPQVVEINGNGTEGFTKYTYTNPDDEEYGTTPASCPDIHYISSTAVKYWATDLNITSLANQMKRISRASSRATERGKLWKKEVFAGGGTSPIASTEYNYNQDPGRFSEKTVGYERIYNKIYPDNTAFAGVAYFINSFHLYNYQNNPTKIIEKTFANGQVNTTTTTLTYKGNSNSLLAEKTVTKSDGSVYKSQYFYPEDKIGDPEYPFSTGMVNKNMVATVLEEKTFRGTAPLTTQKYFYTDITGNGGYKPTSTKSINHTISGAGSEEGTNIAYYSNGNVKEVFKSNDSKTTYIWDYKQTFPIAEVKNAASADDIAYTSFETTEDWTQGGYSQWVYNPAARTDNYTCPSGSGVLDLNYNGTQTITRALNPAKQYVLSLWFNGSSISVSGLTATNGETILGWTYKEFAVTGLSSVTISGTGKIDELRLYPKGAFMTTYAYQPLFGVISKCDVNNRISHFYYDIAGRLSLIRDKDFNVLKKFCYRYDYLNGPQPVNCNSAVFRNAATSQTFYKNDCGMGYEGSAVVFTLPANTFGSDVSQTDVNQRTQEYINSMGQAYANANGSCLCTVNSCTGVDKKCVNGVCETGVKKYISSTYSKSTGLWTCVYVYEFSNCTVSVQYSETSTEGCVTGGLCGD